jgi:hypothetical protein
MKLGPMQFRWIAENAFHRGAHAFHIGPIMIAVQAKRRISDPDHWCDEIAPAPAVNERWSQRL